MADREVVVAKGSSAGALVAGIVAVLLIAVAVWYFGFRTPVADSGSGTEVTVVVDSGATTPAP